MLEAIEVGEIFATRKATRALGDTLTRLALSKVESEHRYFNAAE